jgi:hypothetical protein
VDGGETSSLKIWGLVVEERGMGGCDGRLDIYGMCIAPFLG